MVDVQGVLVFLGSIKDKAVRSRFVPKFRVDRYEHGGVGVDLTSPWGQTGLGIGAGLGKVDLWFGWPRHRESLHYTGCSHNS